MGRLFMLTGEKGRKGGLIYLPADFRLSPAVYLRLHRHPSFQQSVAIFYAYLYPECPYIRPSSGYIPLGGEFAFSADFNYLARKFSIRQGRCCYHCHVAEPYLAYDCFFNINPCPDVFKIMDSVDGGAGIYNLSCLKCLVYNNAVYGRDYFCILKLCLQYIQPCLRFMHLFI